jgi:hypothetical protein
MRAVAHASGRCPSRSPLGASHAPRPPASDACRTIDAPTHGSGMLRSRSSTAAQLYREPSAPDIPHVAASFWGSKGQCPWRGCRGQRPRPPAAQAAHIGMGQLPMAGAAPQTARRAGDPHRYGNARPTHNARRIDEPPNAAVQLPSLRLLLKHLHPIVIIIDHIDIVLGIHCQSRRAVELAVTITRLAPGG